ncbi:hypothetical protein JYK14_02955 [Siccirubricoccus sp. KC 17139]|uniref:Terminase n=1 Tax=Siccirubricoccus soli TaxID=2899147 RepID=A0ABT1CZN8_9PROT|nr:hypothetical protein [Siccirubricoccus soli]MCO6415136.1 hypothetical protein [Siccirubricoccus soli]MCP2681267.1 hypothetical protein [Siccirubricoccus soli]
MNILEALDDKEIFASFFRETSWQPWRAFLKAWAGLGETMSDEELEVFRKHTGRTTPPTVPFIESTLIVGRRAGKSRILATIAVYLAAFRDYEPHLAPGERATVAIIATDRRQARVIFRYVAGLLKAVPLLADLVEAETSDTVELSNRVTIEIATASWRVTRGYTFAAVLADEAAFWRDENSANPADEILRAIRPGLASIRGACLLKASSPYGRKGILYNDYRRFHGKDDARVLVWQAATRDMNPSIPLEVVEEALEEDPAAAAAEWLGQFRDDLSDFVGREVVEACVVDGRHELPPVAGTDYVAFCDPSGGSSDSMTLAIAHQEGDVAVLDLVREVRAPFSPDAVVQDFAAVLGNYGLRRVTGDRYAGHWPAERFAAHGVSYESSELVKSEIYLNLLPTLMSRRIELLEWPRLVQQLATLERRTARGGRDRVDHPMGGHDDVANAAAGALLAASRGAAGGYDLMALVGMQPGD